MPFQDIIQSHFTAAEQADFDLIMTQLEALLQSKLRNLSAEENQQYGVIDEQNKLIVNKVKDYRNTQPALSSPDVDWLEFFADNADSFLLENGSLRINGLAKAMTETRRLHDYDNYQNSLLDYRYTKYKSETQPGTGYDTKAAELKQFFTHSGGGTPPSTAAIILPTNQATPSTVSIKIAGKAAATGTEQFKIDFGDGNSTIGTLENGVLTSYPHTYIIAGQYEIKVTAITAGALELMDVLQIDNCMLYGTLSLPDIFRPSGIQFPNNLVTFVNMQQASYTNLTSYIPYNNNMDASGVNANLIGLDNSGLLNGIANFGGGTNNAPSGAGITAMNNLIAKGWTVLTN